MYKSKKYQMNLKFTRFFVLFAIYPRAKIEFDETNKREASFQHNSHETFVSLLDKLQ